MFLVFYECLKGCPYCCAYFFKGEWRNYFFFGLSSRECCDSVFTEKLKVSMYYLVFCSEEMCAICKAGNVWRKGDSAVSWGLRSKLICLHSDNLTQPSNWLFQSRLLMQSSGWERESFRTCIFMCEGVISRPEPAIQLLILDFFSSFWWSLASLVFVGS